MCKLKLIPQDSTAPADWKRLSNIKHLAILGEQFSLMETPKDIDREGCYCALLDIIAREADHLEISLDEVA